jgi:hypothetical protein
VTSLPYFRPCCFGGKSPLMLCYSLCLLHMYVSLCHYGMFYPPYLFLLPLFTDIFTFILGGYLVCKNGSQGVIKQGDSWVFREGSGLGNGVI